MVGVTRSLGRVYILAIATLGIYLIYWFAKTKDEINSIGGRIPSAIFYVIPIINLWWLYVYAKNFSRYVRMRRTISSYLTYFMIVLIWPVGLYVVQTNLNKIAIIEGAPGEI